jgi:signal transduction histidine kinase
MELMLEPFRLEAALNEVYTVIEPLAIKKELKVTIDPGEGPERIVADRLRFKQVLYNIVSNAVKFTPEGGSIEIRGWRDDGMLYLAIKDSGIGIPPDQVEQIFDVFHRLERSYRRDTEGTGLGLALVRRFIELHGGDVKVESTVGVGSTFTICLPQSEAMMDSLQTIEEPYL